jgi:hypothetical protein
VEALFNLFLWGIAGAMSLAFQGAAFGVLVRVVAQLNAKAPEKTLGQAIANGAFSGGLFLAVIGFLAGVATGLQQPTLEAGMLLLALLAICVLSLMIAAAMFAGLAYFCTWLGVRGTGLLFGMGIALAFAGILAERAGIDVNLIRLVQYAAGVSGLLALVYFRIQSPLKEHAFEPLLVEVESDEDYREEPRGKPRDH